MKKMSKTSASRRSLLKSSWLTSSLLALALGFAPALAASEVQVNTATAGDQLSSDLIGLDDGRYLATWLSIDEAQSKLTATARFLDAGATPVGSSFELSSARVAWARTAPQPGGGFIAVWNDRDAELLVGRRFDATGSGVGAEFQIQDLSGYPVPLHEVGSAANGDFVVAWQNADPEQEDPTELRVRRFEADGTPKEASMALVDFAFPALDVAPDGSFLLAWCPYTSGFDVTVQRFDTAGDPLGAAAVVDDGTCTLPPELARQADGSFLVAWTALRPGNHLDIEARLYDSAGAPTGPSFEIHPADTTGDQQVPVATTSGSGYAVAWSTTPTEDPPYRVRLQRLTASGALDGAALTVDSFSTSTELGHQITENPYGTPVVTWSSSGSFGSDQDGLSVQVRSDFDDLFADGFESGDLSAWSAAVP